MAAWKLAPALACGNTAVLKPAETTPRHRAAARRDPPGGRAAAGRGPDHPRRRRRRRRARARARHRQGRLHRLDRGRQGHPGRAGGPRDPADARAGRQVGEHRVRGRRARPGRRGDRQRDLLQPGPRVLRRLAAPDPGERGRRRWSRSSGTGWAACAWATRSTRTPTSGAINSREQLERIESLVASGEEEGAVRRTVACELPDRGFWFAPTLFTDVAPAHRIAAEEIFGPVVSVLTFRTQAEAIEKANSTPYGLAAGHLDRQGLEGVRGRGGAAGGRRVAEHLQPLRPDRRLRRLQGERLRPRGRDGRAAAVPAGGVVSERLPVRKTYKLFIGGAFVRSESGRYDRSRAAPAPTSTSRAARARTCATPWPPRARRCPAGPARTAYNRGQILYRFAEALESRAADIGAERSDVEASIDVLVHYAGWTDKLQPVLGGINPVAAPFLSFSVPEPTGVVGHRGARRAAAARPGRRAGARARRGEHRRGRAVRRTHRSRAWTSARCWASPTCPAAS